MPCNDPRKVFYIGVNPETGKKKILYTTRFTDYVWQRDPHARWETARLAESTTSQHGTKNPELYKDALKRLSPPPGGRLVTDFDLVPCGQCIGCRLDYARQWAARMMLETKNYKPNECWFVTFTYDDFHLPEKHEVLDPETGEYKKSPLYSVNKRDHQLMMKRLRKALKKRYDDEGVPEEERPKLKFFMSAEYGDTSKRPHYHYVFYGLPLTDLVPYKSNFRGDMLYNSTWLSESCWTDKQKQPIGHVVIGNVDFDSANYVARYTLKKQQFDGADVYASLGIEQEFCLMSRRPGIGKEYFEDNYDIIYETDEIILPGYNGAFTVKPPKYFDSLLERLDEDRYNDIKRSRRDLADASARTDAHRYPDRDQEDLYSARDRRIQNKVIFRSKGEV